jgi:hypothetical protein
MLPGELISLKVQQNGMEIFSKMRRKMVEEKRQKDLRVYF